MTENTVEESVRDGQSGRAGKQWKLLEAAPMGCNKY